MVIATETELKLYVIDWKEADIILSKEEGKFGISDLIGDRGAESRILYSGRKQREKQISFSRAGDSREALRNGFSKLEEVKNRLGYTIYEQDWEGRATYNKKGETIERSVWFYYTIISQESYLSRVVKEDNQQLPLPI